MKKKLVTVLLAMALTASMLSACGDDKAAETTTETKAEEPAEEAPAEEEAEEPAEEATEEETEEPAEETADEGSEGSEFSLLDVSEDMVEIGAYGKSEDGTELVFTMFKGPDGNEYVSLIGFDNNSDNGDVICGQYEASTEKDEDGDEWTNFTVSDVYTGEQFHLGVCERPETEEIVFYDKDGNVVEAQFLSAADTINYMGAAAALLSGEGN
ncbi:MAG: hypothetical protein IKQ40_07355 [Lachnospiraceae bacterium]|nr:hypothetical protein [Lachnospiraceae bacterium]